MHVAAEKAKHGMFREALADVLVDRAAWAHDRIQAGQTHNLELHEETLTQDLLLDISTALPNRHIEVFTKGREARNGADWQCEWWFHSNQWFGMRVQAKRLRKSPSGRLGYDFGYQARGRRQIDVLIKEAHAAGLEPAYVLYNGPKLDVGEFEWQCDGLPASSRFFGISLIPAVTARDLLECEAIDPATVAAHSRPWSCLAMCGGLSGCGITWKETFWHSDDIRRGLAAEVASSYQRLIRYRASDDFDPESPDRQWHGLRREPPGYVSRLLTREVSVDSVLPRHVGALTIFSDSPSDLTS